MDKKESEKLEFKSSFAEWKEAIISLCAFANKKGGKVIVGVKDDGTINEIQIGKNTIEDFANKIKNNTDPILYPSINVKTFGLGEIVEIEVSESDNKPVFAFDRAYIRVGKTSQKMSQTEVRELIKRYALSDFDKMYLEKDLKKIEFDVDLIKKINNKYYKFKIRSEIDFLKKLGLVSKNKITNAGYLCFAKNNTDIYQSIVKAARFKGQSVVKFLDEKEFDGSIIHCVDQTMNFIKRHINTEFVITGKPERDEIWDYPLLALREAVINALIHRDYNDSGNIQIRIFDSSLEIWSPGILPKEINIKNIFLENRSIPRNKKLVEIFHQINLVESWGTGFQRIVEECKKNGNKMPEFSEKAGAFVIAFKRRESTDLEKLGEKLGENQEKILKFIQLNKNITISELAEELMISSTAVENNLAKLKKEGRIKRVGPDKGGYWKIIKK